MRNRDLIALCLCGALLALAGCASSHAPLAWVPSPEEAQFDAYGSWINIERGEEVISGELLSIEGDSLFVGTPEFQSVAAKDISSASLARYDAPSLAGHVLGGALLSLSNGLLAIFTAPMWLIGGPIAASARSREPFLSYPEHRLGDLRAFARYPQGLPAGIDRRLFTAKRTRNFAR